MAKKYIIELTEKQAQLLSFACDQFPRLIQGQDWSFRELFEEAWERRCKDATGNFMDENFEGGWHNMREDAEIFCKEIKRRFWNLAPNANYGVHYDVTADILFDIHQAIRHQLWLDTPDSERLNYTVDASPAHQFGSEPIAKVTSREE